MAKRDPLIAFVKKRIEDSIQTKRKLLGQSAAVVAIAKVLVGAVRAGRKIIFFGNGGSAADAQHLAAELVGRFYSDRRPLPALALTVDTSALTAIGNDYSFDQVFARQLEALGEAGDVAVGITTSGNSANVLEALRVGRRKGIVTVALTGRTGGKARGEADYCLSVPSNDTPRVQESHILLGHILCEVVERAVLSETSPE
jgi:D-sedoheptulose 7-phosphate isomerase